MSAAPLQASAALEAWSLDVRQAGFAFAREGAVRRLLAGRLGNWDDFADSWNDLGPDPYLAATGRQRKRRHAVFQGQAGRFERQAHQPHYQSLAYNSLQGDIARWFEPVRDDIAAHSACAALLELGWTLFMALGHAPLAHIEMHQFRIEPTADHPGEPTPEGIHRDGVDFVLVSLINRVNIASGTTSIHSADGTLQGTFTLTAPLDTALVDDNRVFHGVTAVEPLDASAIAYRDVLVLTYKAVRE